MSDISAAAAGAVANPADLPVLPRDDAPGAWSAGFMIPPVLAGKAKGTTVPITLTDDLLRQEVVDQCEIKKPARMAILRATQKRLAKAIKTGAPLAPVADDHPAKAAYESVRWDCFILFVDGLINGSHVKLRDDEALLNTLLASAKQSKQ